MKQLYLLKTFAWITLLIFLKWQPQKCQGIQLIYFIFF